MADRRRAVDRATDWCAAAKITEWQKAIDAGAEPRDALVKVVDFPVRETVAGL